MSQQTKCTRQGLWYLWSEFAENSCKWHLVCITADRWGAGTTTDMYPGEAGLHSTLTNICRGFLLSCKLQDSSAIGFLSSPYQFTNRPAVPSCSTLHPAPIQVLGARRLRTCAPPPLADTQVKTASTTRQPSCHMLACKQSDVVVVTNRIRSCQCPAVCSLVMTEHVTPSLRTYTEL
jgi:hypothetical protein